MKDTHKIFLDSEDHLWINWSISDKNRKYSFYRKKDLNQLLEEKYWKCKILHIVPKVDALSCIEDINGYLIVVDKSEDEIYKEQLKFLFDDKKKT